MRTAAVLLAAAFAAPAFGQSAPYVAEVAVDLATLRSGPGDQMPDTGTAPRGTRLIVETEEGDWLAVQPPGGQVSWINHKFLAPVEGQSVEVFPRNAVVQAEPDAEVAHGRPGLAKPLDVRRTRVPDGTIVCVIGPKADANGSLWYPIVPPHGDYRYVPKSAVRPIRGQAAPTFVDRSPAPPPIEPAAPPVAALSNPSTAGPRGSNWPNHPLWRQAERAELDREWDRAEQLYLRLAGEMNKPGGDTELANLCYTRVHTVREKQRQGGQTVSRTAADRGRADAPAYGSSGDGKWAGPGKLREAGFKFDRKPTFALMNPQGRVICYAQADGRTDLDRHLGTDVEVYGTVEYPGDLRGAGIMSVGHVRPVAR